VEEAENMAQAPVEHAVVGVAGSHIRGVNSHGGITLDRARARSAATMCVWRLRRRAASPCLKIARPALLPQSSFWMAREAYVILRADGRKLEVRVHIVTGERPRRRMLSRP